MLSEELTVYIADDVHLGTAIRDSKTFKEAQQWLETNAAITHGKGDLSKKDLTRITKEILRVSQKFLAMWLVRAELSVIPSPKRPESIYEYFLQREKNDTCLGQVEWVNRLLSGSGRDQIDRYGDFEVWFIFKLFPDRANKYFVRIHG